LIRRIRATVPVSKLHADSTLTSFEIYDDMMEFINAGLIVHLQMPTNLHQQNIKLDEKALSRADLNKIFNAINELKFTELDSHIIVAFRVKRKKIRTICSVRDPISPKIMLINCFYGIAGMPAANLPGKIDRRLNAVARKKPKRVSKQPESSANRDEANMPRSFPENGLIKHLSA
jgi:hypothetical protein